MKIILHIGQAKTGTTSIQKTFRDHHKACLDAGVLYPVEGNFREQHHLMELGFTHGARTRFTNGGLMPCPISKRAFDHTDFRIFWDRLEQAIRTHRPKILVLSSEMLFNDFSSAESQPGALRNLLHSLAPGAEVTVVAYIRSPKSWFIANAQQLYRQNFRMPRHRLYAAVQRTVAFYCREFPNQVHVHAYDEISKKSGGTLAHFIALYTPELAHLQLSMTETSRENKSIDTETLCQLHESYARLHQFPLGYLSTYFCWLARESATKKTQKRSTPLRLNSCDQVMDTTWLREYLWIQDTFHLRFDGDPWLQALSEHGTRAPSLSENPTADEIFRLDDSTCQKTRTQFLSAMIKSIPNLIKHLLLLETTAIRILFKKKTNLPAGILAKSKVIS